MRTVAALADYVNGYSFKPNDLSGDGVPVVRIRQLVDPNADFDFHDGVIPPRYRINDGDLIFSWSGTLAVKRWSGGEAYLNQHLFRVDPLPGVDRAWLSYVLLDAIRQLQGHMHGSAMTHLTREMLKAIPITLPSLEEQRRIADFLDDRVARIDQIIAGRRQQLDQWELAKLSSLEKVVAGSGPQMRLSRMLSLGAVGVVVNPSTYFQDEGVPFIHGYNVRTGYLDLRDVKKMSRADSNSLSRSQLRAGDVLIVRAGEPGRAAVVTPELAGGNCASVLLLRPSGQLSPEWLVAFMNSPLGRSAVEKVQYGAAQGVINLADVMAFDLPVPSIKRQGELLGALKTESVAIDAVIAGSERQVELLQEYKQSLITAAVTGELDVTTASTRIPE